MFNTHAFYYSATGTAKKVTNALCGELGGVIGTRDLLRQPLREKTIFGENDLTVVGVPVYSGRVPPTVIPSLLNLHGNKTPAVIIVVYGDRAYDDALLELKDILEERGFYVIGAGAFVARHAVFPRYAVGRPDERDLAVAKELAARCVSKLEETGNRPDHDWPPLSVKGKRPYVKPQELPIYPTPGRSCQACGACAKICPVGAIDPDNPRSKPSGDCISCAACIHICPQQTRKFRNVIYHALDILFILINALRKSRRKEPEIFV